MIKIISTILLLVLLSSCVGLGKKQPEVDQLILQENIQRFYARFTERVIEGFYKDTTLPTTARDTVLRQYLLYDQEALKIATAPYPEINLLDMLVFIKLNKAVITRYWIPEVYQNQGWGIYQAFDAAEKDIDDVARKIITARHLDIINKGVRDWLKENPDLIRVEKIRVADFTKFARTQDSNDFSFSISQIFVDTKSAVKAVDQVTLVGNRALFLAQHMPTLLRLQTRIGSQEILKDSISTLQSAPSLDEGMGHMNSLVLNADLLVKDIKSLLNRPRKPGSKGFSATLDQIDSVVSKGNLLLDQATSLRNSDGSTLKELINHAGKILIIVAATTSLFWWGGYYVCKRMLQKESV